MGLQFEDQVLTQPITIHKIVIDIFASPAIQEAGCIGLERIDAGESVWRPVIPLEETIGLLATPPFFPAFNKPFRVRVTNRWPRRFQFSKRPFCPVKFAQIPSEDS